MNRCFRQAILVVAVSFATLQIAPGHGFSADLVPVRITPERRQLIGVTFATVERRDVSRRIETTGNVEPDEELKAYVQTRFAGWIQRVFANQTFQHVSRGDPLFTVYSPELASTEQEYVLALQARARVAGSSVEGVLDGANSLVQAAAERLALMGIPRSEIARLARGGQPHTVLTIYSPVSGYVVDRNAFPNMYVQPETKVYTITDFSTVWVYAAVFQNEIGTITPGVDAVFTVDAYPGASFAGRVDYIWPQINSATRTARVRIAFGNPGARLKPGMYGRISLQVEMGEHDVIPAGGVLRTGTHNVSFIDRGDGYLLPQYVELGPRVGDDLIVLKGLRAGQRIVASANFLIDSESQLQAATESFAPPPASVGATVTTSGMQSSATVEVFTIPSPPVRGRNRVRVVLKDPDGRAIDGAKVIVTFYMAAMPSMEMPAMRVATALTSRGGGVYEGDLTLESGGTWQVTAVATRNGQTLASKQFNLSATGGM